MHLVNCEHPKYVYNKYTREYVRVACGQCDSCRIMRAYKWVQRLDLESQVHKYTYMVTLTYSDENLPALFFSDDMTSLVLNRDEQVCIPLDDVLDYINLNVDSVTQYDKELDYLRDRLLHPLGLPIIYKKDISDFFKRLNINTCNYVTQTFENYRYFCCHEYGPTTYRPHSHMLVWFDNDSIAQRFPELLRQAWSLGYSDASCVYSNGGKSYVAQYVNLTCHLPKIYTFRGLCPSHQESKFPPIGCDVVLDSEIRSIYERILTKRNLWNTTSRRYIFIPISPAVKSRFFPKLQGYSDLSDPERIVVYGAYEELCGKECSFEEFKNNVYSVALSVKAFPAQSRYGILTEYYNRLASVADGDIESLSNSLRRWYFISKRICYFSFLLNVSVRWLVSRIIEFWKKVDYEMLLEFYEFQEVYAKTCSPSELVVMYPEFYRTLKDYVNVVDRPFYIDVALAQFDIYSVSDIPDYKDTFDYQAMKNKNYNIYKDTHKRQFVNAYRDGLLSVEDNQLALILKNYQTN